MKLVTVHAAKTQLSKLIERACEGEEIIVARGKTPVVRLTPVGAVAGRRRPGALKGKFKLSKAFFELLPPSELDAWE